MDVLHEILLESAIKVKFTQIEYPDFKCWFLLWILIHWRGLKVGSDPVNW